MGLTNCLVALYFFFIFASISRRFSVCGSSCMLCALLYSFLIKQNARQTTKIFNFHIAVERADNDEVLSWHLLWLTLGVKWPFNHHIFASQQSKYVLFWAINLLFAFWAAANDVCINNK